MKQALAMVLELIILIRHLELGVHLDLRLSIGGKKITDSLLDFARLSTYQYTGYWAHCKI